MARRLIAVALVVGAAVALAASRRQGAHADPVRNGGSAERSARLRRELDRSRERLREDLARAHEQD